MRRRRELIGFVYLLHFDEPYKHAGHYVGFTESPNGERFEAHLVGAGARLLQVLGAVGIGWQPVRVWRGRRDDERRLKRASHHRRACPVCNVRPQAVRWMAELERVHHVAIAHVDAPLRFYVEREGQLEEVSP